uniref:Uncharacterized protein n=1 Tax=Anguilla anguilla TaxID=7936 RepID=A0A0E9VKD2_ANGAN
MFALIKLVRLKGQNTCRALFRGSRALDPKGLRGDPATLISTF